MKKLKNTCPTCQKTYTADGFRMGFSTLYVGACGGCKSTHTSLSGTPGSVMFDSMRLADLFLSSAFTAGEALGIADPCMLDAEQLMQYASR